MAGWLAGAGRPAGRNPPPPPPAGAAPSYMATSPEHEHENNIANTSVAHKVNLRRLTRARDKDVV